MPRPFALPDLGEGLTEAEIVKVLVREGDVISEDAPLLEVETDKATVEIPSPFSGRVAGIHVQPGQTVKVGHVLVTFDDSSVAAAAPGRRRAASAVQAHPASAASTSAGTGSGRGPSRAANVGSPVGGALPAGASGRAVRTDSSRAGAEAASGAPSVARVGPVPATPATRRLARE